ncbi:TonB-dependent receptor domain-containing protein [Pseudogemmobacter sonorensis]|uniref:TonB-dependent receptor domain-containing protein n=1 Tax=Pseudogemmobacter sonorensis TaxID=2989681 RepID=UPI0036990A0A
MSPRNIARTRQGTVHPSRTGSVRIAGTVSALALSLGLAAPAAAQQADGVYLGQIVITAAGFEQLLKDAPASVSVISGEELAKGDFTSLNDALKSVQGVAVTGTANESDIFIRGLSGAYTLILVDGKRQSTRDARTNGNSGFEQSFIPPVAAIDRIEVVRGPMSSLYGSDAMGGVINIITKRVPDTWGGEVTIDTTVNSDSGFGDKQQLSFYLAGPVVSDRLGFQIWGRAMERDASTATGGPLAASERDLTARFTWTPTDAQDVMLEFGTTRIDRENANTSPSSDNDRDHWSLTHVGRWSFGDTEISLSEEVGQRTTFRAVAGDYAANTRRPEVTNTVLDFKLNTQYGADSQHNVTFGGQFHRTKLVDQNPGLRDEVDYEFSNDQWALFVEDEWRLRDDFALTLGLRYNDHEEYDGHFTPRLYGVWDATDSLTIKGGVSTGFRAPDIRAITPGYAYTTGGSACSSNSPPSCGVIIADPDLKPETSTSFELAALYDTGTMQFGATLFHTKFKDKIENYRTNEFWTGPEYPGAGPNAGSTFPYYIWYNRNVSRATISGLELTLDWQLSDSLQLAANYTYTDSEQKSGDYAGLPLARTPQHMASLRFDWDTPVEELSSWLAVNYHGTEINAGLRTGTNGTPVYDAAGVVRGRKYGAYTTVDVGANYAISDKVSMNVAIYNLLDKTTEVATDYNNTIEGRRAWLGLTTRF